MNPILTVLLVAMPWQNCQVNQVNALPAHSTYYVYSSKEEAWNAQELNSARYLNLCGKWAFEFTPNGVACDQPLRDSLPVPSCIERYGYGKPFYRNIGYVWKEWYTNNPPFVPDSMNYTAHYSRHFTLPKSFAGKQVILYIGSATSNVQVQVNGKQVGYSEDSKLAVEFDITKFVKQGDNSIDLTLHRWCDGTYVEDQDFWRMTGLSRDVYLLAREKSHVEDFFVHADYDYTAKEGLLSIDNITGQQLNGCTLNLQVTDSKGNEVYGTTLPLQKDNNAMSLVRLRAVQPWSDTMPACYRLLVTLSDKKGKVLEVIPQTIGFRRVEIKNRQILLNGEVIEFRGVNRHEIDPDGGYVMSRERMESDMQLLKEYGFNAVRTCHYPDDPYWYELCDKNGIMLVAEANVEGHGMRDDPVIGVGVNPMFLHTVLERNERHVKTVKNHPSVIIWSLGNESGEGENFRQAYQWIKQYDPSRPVHYEQARFQDYSDIYCPMYDSYETYEKNVSATDKPMFLCEYAHAMGNSLGGFKEYWDLFRRYPMMQGGFIWDIADQGLREHTSDGREYFSYAGDYEPVQNSDMNFNCNGIFSPDHRPSPQAIEAQWVMQHEGFKTVPLGDDTLCPIANQLPLRYELNQDGFICQLYRGDEKILQDGTTIHPCFWRAPTDNDYGARLPEKFIRAKDPGFRFQRMEHHGDTLVCIYEVMGLKGTLKMSYLYHDDGIEVTQTMTTSQVTPLFRFGVTMTLPKDYEQMRYFGRGPHENYPDRKASAARAVYEQTVSEQYYPYTRPQENGYHTDMKWAIISNAKGQMITLCSDSYFGLSALHYTVESLDNGIYKEGKQTHGSLVEEQNVTEVHIDSEMMGLACVHSWGALPLPEYRVEKNAYTLRFIIR